MAKWLVPLDVLSRKRGGDDVRLIGGKAVRLVFLSRNEFNVPEATILSVAAFHDALKRMVEGADPKSLLRAATTRAGASRIAEARELWLRANLPDGLEDELHSLWEEVRGRSPYGLAVRTTPTCDDGSLLGLSGLGRAIVGVRGGAALAEAVREAWAAIATPRGLAFLAARGVKELGMAVILQRAVAARSSGTMFTEAHGLRVASTRDRVINATYGIGFSAKRAPVIAVSPFDILRIDSRGRVVESIIAHKPTTVGIATDGGVIEQPSSTPDEPSLRAAEIDELARMAARIERLEAGSWSIEFACDEGRVWVLQARPLTNPAYPDGGDAQTVWSSANVGEALPHTVTPLTFSALAPPIDAGIREMWKAFGCSVPKQAHLITEVHGRFYLNLTQLFRTALQIPFVNPHTFLDLGGGFFASELVREIGRVKSRSFLLQLPFSGARIVKMQLSLDAEVATFDASTDQEIRGYRALDVAILPDEGVARTLRDIQLLLDRAIPLLLTCTATLVFLHLALRKALERVAPLTSDAVAQSIVGGSRHIDSAEPGMALSRVADIARHDPAAMQVLSRDGFGDGETADSLLLALPEGPTRDALVAFFEKHGDRGIVETELAAPRSSEDPRPVMSMLRAVLRDPRPRGEFAVDDAHATSEAALEELVQRLGFVEQLLVRQLRATSQRVSQHRERMGGLLSRILGIMRRAVLEADRRIVRRYPELDATSGSGHPAPSIAHAFFLTIDELGAHLRAPRKDTVALIRARRADFEKASKAFPPPQTFVGAPPPLVMPPAQGQLLRGLPASGGVAEGLARVILHPAELRDFQPGEILVTRSVNVGWTPLFLTAGAVVTEQGGALSHAAVVAREYGIPCVVNLDGATVSISTGDCIRVDGGRGVVEPVTAPHPFA